MKPIPVNHGFAFGKKVVTSYMFNSIADANIFADLTADRHPWIIPSWRNGKPVVQIFHNENFDEDANVFANMLGTVNAESFPLQKAMDLFDYICVECARSNIKVDRTPVTEPFGLYPVVDQATICLKQKINLTITPIQAIAYNEKTGKVFEQFLDSKDFSSDKFLANIWRLSCNK